MTLGKVKSEMVDFLMFMNGRGNYESVISTEFAIDELGLWNE